MADDEEDGAAEGEEQSGGGGGSKKKLFIIVGAAVFVLIAAGGGVYFTGLLDSFLGHKTETADAPASSGEAETKSAAKSGEQSGAPGAPAGPVAFFDVPEMVVTMNTSPRSKAAFMKIHIMLELPSSGDIPRVQLALPRIVDNLQPYLRELRVDELRGSPGAYRLKEEMLTRVRAAVAPTQVNAVLFKDLQIQ